METTGPVVWLVGELMRLTAVAVPVSDRGLVPYHVSVPTNSSLDWLGLSLDRVIPPPFSKRTWRSVMESDKPL